MTNRIMIGIFLVGIQCISLQLNAQDNSLHYAVSYFGNNVWNEGLAFDLEKVLSIDSLEHKNGKAYYKMKSYAASAGLYHDNDSHLGMFITAGWQWRKISRKRWNWIYALQPLGIYRSAYPEAYKLTDDGSVKKVFLPGRNYLAPSLSAGFGRMGRWNPNNGWQVKVNLMTLLPYNKRILPLLSLEMGYHFRFQSSKS